MWCDGQLHVDVRWRMRDRADSGWDFACQIRWGLGCGGTGRLLFVPHHTSSLCVEHICCCAPHKLYSNKSGIAIANSNTTTDLTISHSAQVGSLTAYRGRRGDERPLGELSGWQTRLQTET